jgi:hypothetical protein
MKKFIGASFLLILLTITFGLCLLLFGSVTIYIIITIIFITLLILFVLFALMLIFEKITV